MNWDSIQKLADYVNGSTTGGGVIADEQRNQIESEGSEGNGIVPIKPDMNGAAVPASPSTPGTALSVSTVFDFFQQNQNPTDEQVHSFAEQNGIDYKEFENMIFFLTTKFVNFMRHNGPVDVNSIDPQQLEMGIEAEMSHTPDTAIAKKLALDNLSVTPDYYTRLQEMNGVAGQEANAAAVPIKEPIRREMPGKKKEDMPSMERDEEKDIPVGARNSTDNGTY